jgi:hypothetical protein
MLRERLWEHWGEFESREVVTICDHLRLFLGGKPKGEISRKPLNVPRDRLVKRLGADAVDRGQICVDQDIASS